MRWSDQSIILSLRKMGEAAAVAKIFSREQGVYSGAVRNAFGKVNRGIYQQGNVVQAVWNARVEEQLGTLHSEMEEPIAAFVLGQQGALLAMCSALTLVDLALAERDPHPQLYDHLYYLLQRLKHHLPWQEEYVRLELCLLAECGFGLELDSCAATESRENLIYVSPKSGRAVCAEAGKPYHDKLMALPAFLEHAGEADAADIASGMALTGYFLENRLFASHGMGMPAIRNRLALWMAQQAKEMADV